MKIYISIITVAISLCASSVIMAQNLTGEELLQKAIAYHDPAGKWEKFKGELIVTMESENRPKRFTAIKMNLPKDKFSAVMERGKVKTSIRLKGEDCAVDVVDKRTEEEKDSNTQKMDCDRAKMYRNYYTYLYGLPMKLKDEGTHIAEEVERKTFKGKEYLVLKATYDAEVGRDVWYFYFDPATYAMEIYQFYKTDDNGHLRPDSGEYILLTGMETISGVKMPKTRAWYYNKDDKYLGTDVLSQR